jgi:rare lipoprotein A
LATPTTSGELYNPEQLTAAHPNMALGAVVFVENQQNKRGVYVKINDRFSGDGIKLSKKAYQLLDFNGSGPSIVSIYQD